MFRLSSNCTSTLSFSLLWVCSAISLRTAVVLSSGIALPYDGGSYDLNFFYNFTKYLHGQYNYNSFVIFAPKSLPVRFRPDFVNVRSMEQVLMEDFNVPIITWGLERRNKLRNNIGLNNLVLVQFNNLNDPMLDVVDSTLEGLHSISILFFYFADTLKTPTANEVESFFTWCWSKNMVNVALAFKILSKQYRPDKSVYYQAKTQIFNYSPFPEVTVYNLTDAANKGEVRFIVDRLKNVNGYVFETPLITYLPYAFALKQTENCKIAGNCKCILAGITGRIYNEYINRINGKIQIQEFPVKSIEQYSDIFAFGAAKKRFHIGVTPVITSIGFYNATEASHPISQSRACVIVPVQPHMHPGHSYRCVFQSKSWVLLFVTFVAMLMLQISYRLAFRHKNENRIGIFWEGFFTIVRIWFGQVAYAGLQKRYKSATISNRLNYCLALTMTFILAQMYTATMTSMLTSSKLHKPIDGIEDFLATDLTILTNDLEYELFWKTKLLPEALLSRVRRVPVPYLNHHRRFLNTSFAYIFKSELWEMANYQQKRLNRPLFRMPSSELCTPTFYIRIPLQWDSPFALDLNLFFIRTQEYGLAFKWQEMTNWEAQQLKFIDFKKPDETPWHPLTMHDFKFVCNLFLFLNFLPISVFCLEIIWCHLCLKAGRQKLKKRMRVIYERFLKKIK